MRTIHRRRGSIGTRGRDAADVADNASAQSSLGTVYADGLGVLQDQQEAVRWFRAAAEEGDARGQNNLGVMYASGRGVLQDDAVAFGWFENAAEQGNALCAEQFGRHSLPRRLPRNKLLPRKTVDVGVIEMPRDDRVFSLLLACPTDVQDEAGLVRSAVEEVNRGVGALQGVRLEVVDWQTHASPGIGLDAQDVINRQLPDCDIFLGVMWARFGTQTPRAGPGTEEEFDRALTRYQNNRRSVKILFYFKEKPLAPNTIEPAQLQKVKAFRERLQQEGVFYGAFKFGEEFERQLRRDLGQQVKELVAIGEGELSVQVDDGSAANLREETTTADDHESTDDPAEDDGGELGFLDYVDRADEQFAESRVVTERLGAAIAEVGGKMRQRTEEMSDAVAGGTQLSRQEARVLFGKAADDMNCFSDKLTRDLPSFRSTLSNGVAAVREAARLIPEGPKRDAQLTKAIDDLGGLRDSLDPAIDGVVTFQDAVRGLPKMTRELNVAKKRVSAVLDEVLAAMNGGRHLVRETIALIEAAVSDSPVELAEEG